MTPPYTVIKHKKKLSINVVVPINNVESFEIVNGHYNVSTNLFLHKLKGGIILRYYLTSRMLMWWQILPQIMGKNE